MCLSSFYDPNPVFSNLELNKITLRNFCSENDYLFFFNPKDYTRASQAKPGFQSLSSMIWYHQIISLFFFLLTFSFTICKMEMIISIFMRLLWGLNAKRCIKWLKQNIVRKKYSPKKWKLLLIYSYYHFCLLSYQG